MAKKSRRTYTAKKRTHTRKSGSVSKRRTKKNALPLAAFKKSIGKKFQQIKEKENDHAHGTSSKSKGRREGL